MNNTQSGSNAEQEDLRFDRAPDRRKTPASKFNPAALVDLFGTEELYPFWIADQDFALQPDVREALLRKARQDNFGYEYKPEAFWEAILGWYRRRHSHVLERDQVSFTPTIMSSIAMALELFTGPGESVIIQTPVYPDFEPTISRSGRRVIENPLLFDGQAYHIDFELLEKQAARADAGALLFCNPHNPVGRVWTESEVHRVAEICRRYDMLLLADEVHADIVYPGHRFIPSLSLHEVQDRLIALYAPTKTFNLAAAADSMAFIPDKGMRRSFEGLRLKYNLGRTNAFACAAMTAAYSKGDEWVDALRAYLHGNAELAVARFRDAASPLRAVEPEGTYLLWIDARELLPTESDAGGYGSVSMTATLGKSVAKTAGVKGQKATESLVRRLGMEAGVGLRSGVDFGTGGEGFLRMNFACPRSVLEAAVDRIIAVTA